MAILAVSKVLGFHCLANLTKGMKNTFPDLPENYPPKPLLLVGLSEKNVDIPSSYYAKMACQQLGIPAL